MLNKTLYPKINRISLESYSVITEKLDGSNLIIGKEKESKKIFIAQRNWIYYLEELEQEEVREKVYNGLYEWLSKYKNQLEALLQPGAVICTEYLGIGKLKYHQEKSGEFPQKIYMFAKTNITDINDQLSNIYYNHELFKYSFVDQKIPDFIGVVPIVYEDVCPITVPMLNELYDTYTDKVGRNVEGFVINNNNHISKYVRMKNGKLQPHHTWENW